ncbi:hypothetical protein COB57_03235 [Candidatus Peregrinibacteria bacterium]|nr:MAG: hypothetical protein COB57_03235 [Candidatus Peregrinibacteria bacterium]
MSLLESVSDDVGIVKISLSSFLPYGEYGMAAIKSICEEANSFGMFIIFDSLLSDIGLPGRALAEMFGKGAITLSGKHEKMFAYDAITSHPYFADEGLESIASMNKQDNVMAFFALHTDGRSADVQNMPVGDALVYENIAEKISRLGTASVDKNKNSAMGVMLSGLYEEELNYMRSVMPQQYFFLSEYKGEKVKVMEDKKCIIGMPIELQYVFRHDIFKDVEFSEAFKKSVQTLKSTL